MLRPGGHVGFSDLVFSRPPTAAEDRALRALLYHSGRDLLAAHFSARGGHNGRDLAKICYTGDNHG